MKKKILRNLFCAIAFAAICFSASQAFATVNFDLKTPTTGSPCLNVYDFDTTGTTTNQSKVVKNVKDALIQVDVISVPGTETLTLALEWSVNDDATGTAYGSMTSMFLTKLNIDATSTTGYAIGSQTALYFPVEVGGSHTAALCGSGTAYASTVTGSTTMFRLSLPCEAFVKVRANMLNGATGNNPCKFRVSFIDTDPFGHNPKNP